jgi:hypothetical protein
VRAMAPICRWTRYCAKLMPNCTARSIWRNHAHDRAQENATKKTKKPHRDTHFFSSIAQMSKRFKAPRAHYVVKSQVCIAKSTIIILQLCNVLATMNKTTKIKTGHNFFVRSDGIQYKFRVSHEIAH